MIMGVTMFIILLLLALTLSFGFACILTWAITVICSLLGVTLVFSWKLVLAIWIISSIFTTRITVNK